MIQQGQVERFCTVMGAVMLASAAWGMEPGNPPASGSLSLESPPLDPAQVAALVNPLEPTPESIKRGRTLYFAMDCKSCHGDDGKATIEVVAIGTDLTHPPVWRNGSKDGEIFRSIRDGAGVSMPPFRGQLTQENQIWDLVNFIKSLWPSESP